MDECGAAEDERVAEEEKRTVRAVQVTKFEGSTLSDLSSRRSLRTLVKLRRMDSSCSFLGLRDRKNHLERASHPEQLPLKLEFLLHFPPQLAKETVHERGEAQRGGVNFCSDVISSVRWGSRTDR